MFRNYASFYEEEFLAPRPTPSWRAKACPVVRYCLFNIFAANLQIGGRLSIRNLRKLHALVTGTQLPRQQECELHEI